MEDVSSDADDNYEYEHSDAEVEDEMEDEYSDPEEEDRRPRRFVSSFAPRMRSYPNSLLTPVIPPSTAQTAPASRTTKRGTVVVNYSEDLLGDEDFDESDGPRRPTGLRSRREDPNPNRGSTANRLGEELTAPVDIQGIWRDWMGKVKPGKTDVQINTQASLPLTLVPIRIDLDIASFTPQPALPLPSDAQAYGINPSLPAYKTPDPTPAYRLKDYFLWNLQEAMMTPDQFALTMVQDLDLPNPPVIAVQISNQIRQQLEEYATVAAHPLFRTLDTKPESGTTSEAPPVVLSKDEPVTPVMPSTQKNHENGTAPAGETWSAKANDNTTATVQAGEFGANNPDDAYRCIVSLNINLGNKLFTDKFEWSLIHPPGSAEKFTRQLCADMGLAGEWVPAIVHGIYEAVLKLKKEVCESGNLTGGEIDNMALEGQEAGWRFDPEHLCEEWEPKIEILSKEEIEKRDGDRERQIRRVRRETARFSSTTNMAGGMPTPGGLFDQPDHAETPMGRGERSKKRKRMRSLSPTGRGGTPAGTPDTGAAGYGSAGGLNEWERVTWRCSHCLVHGTAVWAVRDGPSGPKTLCNNCSLYFEREKKLSPYSKDQHKLDVPLQR